jgi:hypothetical protein
MQFAAVVHGHCGGCDMSTMKDKLQGLAMELGAESPLAADQRDEAAAATGNAATATGTAAAAAGNVAPATGTAAAPEFDIHAAGGRIYAQDTAGKVIDIGSLAEEGGIYGYRLDAGAIQGQGFADLDATLRHLAGQLTFLYLDALFLQLPDSADVASLHPMSQPALRITLAPGTDELRNTQDQGD